MKGYAVYYLLDPRTMGPRYVGYSHNPEVRFNSHLRQARNSINVDTHKLRWIRSLEAASLSPILAIQCWVEPSEVCRVEIALIAALKQRGIKLTNSTEGGDGVVEPTLEVRQKISKSVKALGSKGPWFGKKMSDEHRAKLSASHKGKIFSEQQRINMANASRGRVFSKERREKISLALRNRPPHSFERRAKISKTLTGKVSPKKGKKVSEETLQRIRATRKRNKTCAS